MRLNVSGAHVKCISVLHCVEDAIEMQAAAIMLSASNTIAFTLSAA